MDYTIKVEVNEVNLYNAIIFCRSDPEEEMIEHKVISDCPNDDIAHAEANALIDHYVAFDTMIQEQIRRNTHKNLLLLYGEVLHTHDWMVDGEALRLYTVDYQEHRHIILMKNGDVLSIRHQH